MKQYLEAVKEILETGTRKENRTGVDTISTFNINYEIDLREGFPLLTTKKISWKNIVVENLWFLSGDTHVELLRKHNCKFWDAWADQRARVPSAYGNFWRHFPVHDAQQGTYTSFDEDCSSERPRGWNDQLEWIVDQLRNNPTSRRLVVTAWAPGNAQTSKLPPCHCLYIFNVQNTDDGPTLNLHLTQRSCDVALGVPYNIAGYAFLLSLIGHITGIKPGIFAHTLVDAHAYTCKPDGSMAEYDHIPGLKEQLNRDPRPLPRLRIHDSVKGLGDIAKLLSADTEELLRHFQLSNYDPYPAISFKVAV